MSVQFHPKLGWLVVAGFLLSACAPTVKALQEPPPTQLPEATFAPAPESTPKGTPESLPSQEANTAMDPTQVSPLSATLPPGEQVPLSWRSEFSTDFNVHSVPYSEILSGGPRKDGIPAIDDPKFVSVEQAGEWLEPQEPVIFVQAGDQARAYPIQILMWHEIVNDTVGDLPLVVTFCPLCNTGIAFERTVDGQVFDFGTTGRLRFSNLVMYDRQTETWWQQASGEAIAGELTGTQLVFRPAPIIAWDEFKASFPTGEVLSRETGFSRGYGQNPYTGYDNVNSYPFLFDGPRPPDELPPMARVFTVDLGAEAVAYPYDVLQEVHVVNDSVAGEKIVLFWAPGTASALDAGTVAAGQDVGATNAFSRQVDGETLTFTYDGSNIVDDQTGSEWNLLGQAVNGPLAGTQLDPVVGINHFWFSWAAFKPETRIYQP